MARHGQATGSPPVAGVNGAKVRCGVLSRGPILAGQAARWYSLIPPLRIRRRRMAASSWTTVAVGSCSGLRGGPLRGLSTRP